MDMQVAGRDLGVVRALQPGEQRRGQPVGLLGPQAAQRRERVAAEQAGEVGVGEQDERGQLLVTADDPVRPADQPALGEGQRLAG